MSGDRSQTQHDGQNWTKTLWFTGLVHQFVAVFQEHKLILFLKRIDEVLGCVGGEHDLEWTT